MKTCDTCTHYKPRFIPCYGCHNNDGWEPKPQTNGDRIRAMTDEELAKFVNDAEFGFLDRPGMCDVCDHHLVKACLDCWLDWLRQEATT